MGRDHTVQQVSVIEAPSDRVWERVVTPEGINHELGPWLRMTMPRALRGRTIQDAPVGERLGRSWILFARLIPVDFDDIGLAELEPGRRFLERSTMLTMSRWEHERIVDPWPGGGAAVTDRLSFTPRAALRLIPGGGAVAEGIVRRLFAHRHRRLAAHFSGDRRV